MRDIIEKLVVTETGAKENSIMRRLFVICLLACAVSFVGCSPVNNSEKISASLDDVDAIVKTAIKVSHHVPSYIESGNKRLAYLLRKDSLEKLDSAIKILHSVDELIERRGLLG